MPIDEDETTTTEETAPTTPPEDDAATVQPPTTPDDDEATLQQPPEDAAQPKPPAAIDARFRVSLSVLRDLHANADTDAQRAHAHAVAARLRDHVEHDGVTEASRAELAKLLTTMGVVDDVEVLGEAPELDVEASPEDLDESEPTSTP